MRGNLLRKHFTAKPALHNGELAFAVISPGKVRKQDCVSNEVIAEIELTAGVPPAAEVVASAVATPAAPLAAIEAAAPQSVAPDSPAEAEPINAETATANEEAASTGPSFEELLARLERLISYAFRDRALLRRALTHRSYANEQTDPRPPHNEALEFLGDAVLEFLISAWLLELYPTQTEGTLSKLRAYAVSAVNLQKHAVQLRLGDYLLLNRGEEKTGGRNKMALQVDAYEALIAAIYLDGGIEAAKEFVRREFAQTFVTIDPQNLAMADYKTALQERLQSLGLPTPHYAIVESLGPDHHRIFQIELRVSGKTIATGQGTTIKGAHQAAARWALDNLAEQLEKTNLLPAAAASTEQVASAGAASEAANESSEPAPASAADAMPVAAPAAASEAAAELPEPTSEPLSESALTPEAAPTE